MQSSNPYSTIICSFKLGIDLNSSSRPPLTDICVKDTDEVDMLSEARARLANTRGKKSKRKSREVLMSEATPVFKIYQIRNKINIEFEFKLYIKVNFLINIIQKFVRIYIFSYKMNCTGYLICRKRDQVHTFTQNKILIKIKHRYLECSIFFYKICNMTVNKNSLCNERRLKINLFDKLKKG